MSKIIYLPLEILDKRYTFLLDQQIQEEIRKRDILNVRVYGYELTKEIKSGSFLDAVSTNHFKYSQLMEVMKMFQKGEIHDGDTFLIADLWFPGLEGIKYTAYFLGIDIKIVGFMYAGSWTDTDFVNAMQHWARDIERGWMKMIDKVFVGSMFLKMDIFNKGLCEFNKMYVTGFSYSERYIHRILKKLPFRNKEDIIVFTGRLVDEKQPHLFEVLKIRFEREDILFVKTMTQNMNKAQYFDLLRTSKFIFSAALQENFGYGILEAVTLGCIPILPNRLVYPEFYPKECLYDTIDEAEQMIRRFLKSDNSELLDQLSKIPSQFDDSVSRAIDLIQPKQDD